MDKIHIINIWQTRNTPNLSLSFDARLLSYTVKEERKAVASSDAGLGLGLGLGLELGFRVRG